MNLMNRDSTRVGVQGFCSSFYRVTNDSLRSSGTLLVYDVHLDLTYDPTLSLGVFCKTLLTPTNLYQAPNRSPRRLIDITSLSKTKTKDHTESHYENILYSYH